MKKILIVLIPLGIIALSVFGAMAMFALREEPEKKPAAERRLLVEAVPVELTSVAIRVPSQGTVRPRTETTMVSEVSGKIVKVSANLVAGGFFRRGDVLLQVDPADYDVNVKQAKARVAQAKAQLAQEQARSDQALKDWNQLGRKGQPNELVLRRPQVAEAAANVDAAEADLLRAKRDLEKTKIRAPYNGLVRSKAADVGRYVTPGTPVASTYAVDSVEIRLPLSDADLAFLDLPSIRDSSVQPQVLLTASVGGQRQEWLATIVRTEGVIDERNRVTYAVAQIDDPYQLSDSNEPAAPVLPIGTFVEADIAGIWVENVALLPRHVLREDNSVLLVGSESQLELRRVTVLRADERYAYIIDGLSPGDRLITSAVNVPIPGMALAVAEDDSAAYDQNEQHGEAIGVSDSLN